MSPKFATTSGWILCRNLQAIPIPDAEVLESWAERERVRPDDYLVNPALDTCFQAREVAELDAIFRRTRIRRLLAPWNWLVSKVNWNHDARWHISPDTIPARNRTEGAF